MHVFTQNWTNICVKKYFQKSFVNTSGRMLSHCAFSKGCSKSVGFNGPTSRAGTWVYLQIANILITEVEAIRVAPHACSCSS